MPWLLWRDITHFAPNLIDGNPLTTGAQTHESQPERAHLLKLPGIAV